MESFQSKLSAYVEVTKRLDELNKQASELRDNRNSIEMDLAALIVDSGTAVPDKIRLERSKMMFTYKKPGEWKKGWTLSKKQLQEYVMEILPEHGEDLLREISVRHERKLIGDDYKFDLKPISDE
jgi:hypothetical protein